MTGADRSDRAPSNTHEVQAVFAALADPTRREVVARLAAGEQSPTELADVLPISRQAVSKHLASLDAAGLVRARRVGRERRYALEPAPLTEVLAWIGDVGGQWDRRLARLAEAVDQDG